MAKVNIKCFTLIQPWAQLCVMNAKHYETRSYKTNYRGDLYIHASSKAGKHSITALCKENKHFSKFIPHYPSLQFSAIVGRVTLTDVVPVEKVKNSLSDQELAFGDYSAGRYAWKLENPIEFTEVIKCSGALSIWNKELNDDYLKSVLEKALVEDEEEPL